MLLLQVVGLDVQRGTIGHVAELVISIFVTAGGPSVLTTVLGLYVLIVGALALLRRWQIILNITVYQEFILYLRQRLYRVVTRTRLINTHPAVDGVLPASTNLLKSRKTVVLSVDRGVLLTPVPIYEIVWLC